MGATVCSSVHLFPHLNATLDPNLKQDPAGEQRLPCHRGDDEKQLAREPANRG